MSARTERRAAWVGPGSVLLSVLGHATLVVAGAFLLSTGVRSGRIETESARSEIAVDVLPLHLPVLDLGPGVGEPVSAKALAANAPSSGGEGIARLDTARKGRGGSNEVGDPAINLADRDEGLSLSREIKSRVDRDQFQRLATAVERASTEDRRATTHPMDLVFLAIGAGALAERHPFSPIDPNRGALESPDAAMHGSLLGAGAEPSGETERSRKPGGLTAGGRNAFPGVGIQRASIGAIHRRKAAVATGKPLVVEGPPSVPSDRVDGPRDTVDSEQEVAAMVQSIVHASTAGGVPGKGPGGQDAPGLPGSGGDTGNGSQARPFGDGNGGSLGLDAADPRISLYQRSVRDKVDPLWEFPKSAALEGKQGYTVISLVVRADGQVSNVQVARPSGIPEFDENVRTAVLRAAPFPPFPPTIPGPTMRFLISFDAKNPAVR